MSMARRTAAMEEELGNVLALEAYGAAGYSTHVIHVSIVERLCARYRFRNECLKAGGGKGQVGLMKCRSIM